MNLFRATLLIAVLFVSKLAQARPPASDFYKSLQGSYSVHLFFNDKEYVDYLHLKLNDNHQMEGLMDVPDDFQAPINRFYLHYDYSIQFLLPVPKNPTRPRDLVFHYKINCFDNTCKQLNGFVRMDSENGPFVASVILFKQTKTPSTNQVLNRIREIESRADSFRPIQNR